MLDHDGFAGLETGRGGSTALTQLDLKFAVRIDQTVKSVRRRLGSTLDIGAGHRLPLEADFQELALRLYGDIFRTNVGQEIAVTVRMDDHAVCFVSQSRR